MTAVLALLSSVFWGGADFLGGTLSRRLPALVVVAVSQAVAAVLLVPVALAVGGPWADPGDGWLLWGVLGGVAGLVGLGCFYAALAAGTMGVVAPVAALGVVVPVAVGLLQGERPSALQLSGVVVAVVGVVLASGPELRGAAGPRPLVLAAVAAVGFGVALVTIAEGSGSSVVLTLLAMRLTSSALLGGWLGARTAAGRRDVAGGLGPRDLPLLAAIGIGDVAANATFAVASRSGLVSVVAVLASLYPVVTALLAWRLQHERLRAVQVAGVAAALAGVVMLAAG